MKPRKTDLRNVQRAGICALILAGVAFEKSVWIVGGNIKAARHQLPPDWQQRVAYQAPYRPDAAWPAYTKLRRRIGAQAARAEFST